MITPQTFFTSYQLHHHRAKAGIFMSLLENMDLIKAESIVDPIYGFKQQDYERTLRIEMRTNLFHAIETLFTLFFCLQPDVKGKIDDIGLFEKLNKKKFYYKDISDIAAGGIESLGILDSKIDFNGQQISLGQYIFYYSLKSEKMLKGVGESLKAIKYGLHLLAGEMNETAEYNSYKHSLRALPAVQEIAFARKDTMEIVHSLNALNSMTYFQEYKEGGFSYTTKAFDTKRDYGMTLLASNLIYNIINFRRASIVRDLEAIPVPYYSKESIDATVKKGEDIFQFVNKVMPAN